MGGRGASSTTSALRIRTPEKVVYMRDTPMADSEVNEILDMAVANGDISYVARRDDKKLQRDLFVHAVLCRDGWRFSVLGEEDGQKNVDLLLVDGEYWEIKSPKSQGDAKNHIGFVDMNLRKAVR